MEININRKHGWADIEVTNGGATIEDSINSTNEAREFAKSLMNAIYTLGPKSHNECCEWIFGILDEIGVEAPASCRESE